MTTLGLIASWSRGAWLGFVAAIATIVIARGPRAVAAVTVGLLVILAAAQISGYAGGNVAAALASRLADLQDYATITDPRVVEITDANFPIVQRQAQWWAAWGMFSDHPWLGVGIGNYAVAYPDYTLPRWYEPLGHAHNYYLNVAAETGLIGLAAYELAGLATFVWVGRQVRRLRGWPQAFAIGVMGVLVHLTVHNLFDNLYVQHMILHLALLLGIIVTLSSRWQESSQSS
jgi:O-antigen ligase